MNQEEEYDYIEKYVLGQLDASERDAFDERVKTDEEFKQKVAAYSLLIEGVTTRSQGKFFDQMQDWDEELDSKKSNNFFQLNKTYFKAAAAVLLIIASVGMWIATSTTSNQQLFNSYYQPYADVISSRSTDGLLQEAMNAYKQQDYNEAILLFQRYLNENPDDKYGQLYFAESLLATEQFTEARDYYLQLKSIDLFKGLAEWRLALIYLQTREKDLLENQLNQIIAAENHDYYQEAKELLEKLD